MKNNKLILNYGKHHLSDTTQTWKLNITYARGHTFVHDATVEILFTRPELEKMHLHFFHPSTGKLYNLLKRVRPEDTDTSIKAMLEEILAVCMSFSEHHVSPFRFRASIPPDELIFDHELAADLMWIDNAPVLHVIDTDTMYQDAEFIVAKTAAALWESFLRSWVTLFIGYPNTLRLDQESAFDSVEFRKLSNDAGIALQFSGIESNDSLGVGEKYHGPLRRVLERLEKISLKWIRKWYCV